MDFTLSDDRRMVADSLTRLLAASAGGEHRRRTAYQPPFHDPDTWQALTEMGLPLMLLPEAAGGMGGAGFDITCLFEPLGRALSPEPVLPQVMAARLLLAARADCDALLAGHRYAVALCEPDAPFDLAEITCAARNRDGWRLTGQKSAVYGLPAARTLLVAARSDAGLALFSVDADDARTVPYAMIDGGGSGELLLEDTPATLLLADAAAALEDARDWGALALCAEALGVIDVTLAMTRDYLATRQQFGQPIGANQALQHRLVDLFTAAEQARSITILAASRMAGPGQSRAVSMAKHLVGESARQVAEEAIQMHGGIGVTWEADIAHYAKRLVMLDAQLGDSDTHLARLADYANASPDAGATG